ncbi:hypothetical protein SAMN04488131_101432 [Flavobacterium xueshanense]|uniref:Uncharacterized protein n=2 Tax=Flavobacterium xueshanense TaxID=935223 RepID=A0A1I1ZRW4_9FLAO|nr:hypothetical protein SAMN04488131_101432 [Flavobacterium xueshanense]
MQYKFSGMTVNERLYVAGLMNDFEICLKQKDFEGINSVLKKVELNEDSIIEIINSLKLMHN